MENKNRLWNFFGAKESKNGNRINFSIVTGEGNGKEWGTISIDKSLTREQDGFIYFKVKKLEPKQVEEKKPAAKEADENKIPF